MASETIVTALFLIAAVVAAGVLVAAVFPIISRTADTFGTVAHSTDNQIRTDITIINSFANSSIKETDEADIWLKNTGLTRIPKSDLLNSDIFFGSVGNFGKVSDYSFELYSNPLWLTPGETLHYTIKRMPNNDGIWPAAPDTGANKTGYFAIVLPNGVKRSIIFKVE